MEKALTPAEKSQLNTLNNNLKATPKAFAELSAASRSLLTKEGSFIDEQRAFFHSWWLEVDSKKVDAINTLLPPNTICEPRIDNDGLKWVNSDLLSDKRLAKLLPELQGLTLVNKDETHWPEPMADK